MKKIYVLILIIFLTPIAVYAWNDCPYGLVNDPFPGQCPRYEDTNQDGVCDHSQSPSGSSSNNSSENRETDRNAANISSSDIQNAKSVPSENYFLVPLSITILIIYLITYLFYLENRLKRDFFYKIWNYVLIISFLVTGATGLILMIVITQGITSSWNLTIDFWHAEFGIIMVVSTLFHFHLYWKQLKNVVKA